MGSINYYSVFFLLVLCFSSNNVLAQTSEKKDSLANAESLSIYDQPEKAILDGAATYKNIKNAPKIRVRGLLLMADGYTSKRDYQKSLQYVLKAYDFSQTISDDLLKIEILRKVAAQYHQLKIYDKAIEFLEKSEKLCSTYPVRDSVHLLSGNNYVLRGFIYKEQLNCEVAIPSFEKGLKEYERVEKVKVNRNVSITLYNVANCNLMLGDIEAARKNFTQSLEIARIIKAKSLIGFSLKGLAEVYTLDGNYKKAIQLLKEALVTSEAVGDLVLNQTVYKGLSENYLATANFDMQLKYHLAYLKTEFRLKEIQRKSISDSLIQHGINQKSAFDTYATYFQYGFITLFLITLSFVVFMVFLSKKSQLKTLTLRERIEILQNKS